MATLKNVNLKVPETVFEWEDKSSITEAVTEQIITPVFMAAFASPKGTENTGFYTSKNFYKEFGSDINFEKYGQAFLQAERTIRAGGKLLCKRVVADDSTLANIAIVAHVKKSKIQKTDVDGNLLYLDEDKKETTEAKTTITTGSEETGDLEEITVDNTPIYLDKPSCTITYTAHSIQGKKTLNEIADEIDSETYYKVADGAITEGQSESEESSFPLFVLTETGRGTSKKRFRITQNTTLSKHADFTYYNFELIEDSKVIESFTFALDPNTMVNTTNISIQNIIRTSSYQLQCKMFDDYILQFLDKVADYSGNTIDYVKANDILFGVVKGKSDTTLDGITIAEVGTEVNQSYNFAYEYGNDLKNGTNGAFGEYPLKTEAYKEQLAKFFGGEITNTIYDLDNYKIDIILDANYPNEVKRKIEELAAFREDLVFFEDMGTGINTLTQILDANAIAKHDRTIYINHLSYDILHPYTNKQVRVTYTYTFATLLVDHFNNGRIRALAGKRYGITIPEAIEGTVNFIPMTTPSERQKDILVDNKVNYGVYYDGTLVIETQYTSQEANTQLSFVNNVLAAQEVVKKVRSRCPLIRYAFLEGQENLLKYKEDVQAVLDTVSGNFKSLTMEYFEDTTMLNNKVFYAGIVMEFKNFVQKEYFKLTTLS